MANPGEESASILSAAEPKPERSKFTGGYLSDWGEVRIKHLALIGGSPLITSMRVLFFASTQIYMISQKKSRTNVGNH